MAGRTAMHVAVDARELVGRATGAGRYLSQLLTAWAALPDARAHRFTLFSQAPIAHGADGLRASSIILPGAGGTWWEQVTLASALRRGRYDVLFAPAYTAPLSGSTPLALAVHDVSFAAHPEWFRPRERWRRRWVTTRAARRARVILTLSAFSRGEIVQHLGIAPLRVHVVPLGTGLPAPTTRQTARPRPGDSPSILFVGSIFNRRHVPALIEALPHVSSRHPGARLVIVGDNRTWPRQDLREVAKAAGVAPQVTDATYVDDNELDALYANASAFVFLSEYEGFGLTPLEALARGVPTLVLDTPVAREVYGDAADYVATPDPVAVSQAILRILDSAGTIDVIERARPILTRYDWRHAAEQTLAAILEAGTR
jgi:glycosyltransferase involved in cell wall biosynthesis